jgi:Domain of unknown function (DUF4395)
MATAPSSIQCPVDFVTINENQARLTAFQTLVWVIVWAFTGFAVIPAYLAIDFLLRAANFGKFSLLNIISGFLIRRLSIPNRPVDRAPKRFAALVGFIFIATILVLSLLRQDVAAEILAGVLLIFASLEAFARICAGCYVYTLLKTLFPGRSAPTSRSSPTS